MHATSTAAWAAGARYFMWSATVPLRGASVPHLPEDVRRLVWSRVFPVPWMACSLCGEGVLFVDAFGQFVVPPHARQYTMRDGLVTCFECKARVPPAHPTHPREDEAQAAVGPVCSVL